MAFLDCFTPDDVLPDVYAVTPESCARMGVKAVVFDIDNTLAPYEVSVPDERLKAHLRSFPASGVAVALVSNNKPERVEIFNRELGFFAQPDAHKPKKDALKTVLAYFAPLSGREILFVGDQLFTDVLTARKNGIRAVTVPPIQPRENWFFRLKRALEKPVMRRFRRLEKQRKTEQIEKRK